MDHQHSCPTHDAFSRRKFIGLSSACSLALSTVIPALAHAVPLAPPSAGNQLAEDPGEPLTVQEYLHRSALTREEVDTFLDPKKPNRAKFDPELGYTFRDNILKDGMDDSRTLSSYQKTGERTMINYAHRPCRINAYGDSFTQGDQVSDGETWEEYLAAHLGEPIRNFGIGHYGTYQAYRRMRREEATSHGAEYLILNVWDIDDYLRSIDSWLWIRMMPWKWRKMPGHESIFHGNPWVHARLDLESGELVEKENSFSTPKSLLQLTDPDFVYEHFKNDLVVKLVVAQQGGIDFDRNELEDLSRKLNVKADFSSAEAVAETAHALHIEYALRTGMRVIEKALELARVQNKKILILLSCHLVSVIQACEGRPRVDQSVVDFLRKGNILFADGLAKHLEDFKSFNLNPQQYVKRYYIGHYNPTGNHFFAFAIKDTVVSWLDPKPLPYREGSETIPDYFERSVFE